MELTRNVRRWGNSAGVLLPKEFEGKEVKIILIDRTLEIKKEIFSILSSYLEDILGIYLVGSYARGEETEDSDIDIIAISKNTRKEIISGKYHISITPLDNIKKTMKAYPELVFPRLMESKAILNYSLLEELQKIKIEKSSFKNFVEDSKRVIKINKGFLELDKNKSDYVKTKRIVYSLILRLRGILLIKGVLEKKKYSNKIFKKWLLEILNEEEFEKAYSIYMAIKDNKKESIKLRIETAEKLLVFFEEQLKYFKK